MCAHTRFKDYLISRGCSNEICYPMGRYTPAQTLAPQMEVPLHAMSSFSYIFLCTILTTLKSTTFSRNFTCSADEQVLTEGTATLATAGATISSSGSSRYQIQNSTIDSSLSCNSNLHWLRVHVIKNCTTEQYVFLFRMIEYVPMQRSVIHDNSKTRATGKNSTSGSSNRRDYP